jgi:phosphatidylglycerol:prolipoprotein diacylglycerol transferase
MLPYIQVGDIHLGPLTVHPFGLLVATGIGVALAERRARRLGLDVGRMRPFVTWILVGGFVGGHVLDEVFYHPYNLAQPWTLLFLWEGLSSFGGFAGALAGALAWSYLNVEKRPQGILPPAEAHSSGGAAGHPALLRCSDVRLPGRVGLRTFGVQRGP